MKKSICEEILVKIEAYRDNEDASPKKEDLFEEIIQLCVKLITMAGVEESEVKKYIQDHLKDKEYVDFEKAFEANLAPYHELTFLREREEAMQKDIVRILFDRTILVMDDLDGIEQELMLEKHEIITIRKLLTTLRRSIVLNNLSERLGTRLIREFFGLSQDVAEATSRLFCDNREKIQYSALCARIMNIEESMEPILQVLNDMLQPTD